MCQKNLNGINFFPLGDSNINIFYKKAEQLLYYKLPEKETRVNMLN